MAARTPPPLLCRSPAGEARGTGSGPTPHGIDQHGEAHTSGLIRWPGLDLLPAPLPVRGRGGVGDLGLLGSLRVLPSSV